MPDHNWNELAQSIADGETILVLGPDAIPFYPEQGDVVDSTFFNFYKYLSMLHSKIFSPIFTLFGVFACQFFIHAQPTHPDKAELKKLYESTNGASWNSKWDTTTNNICEWVGIACDSNQRVSRFILPNNNLTGTLPSFSLPALESLYLHANKITGNLPNFNLPNLKILYLDDNKFTGTIPNYDLPELEKLYMVYNQLSGSIPDFNLPKLRELVLVHNKLTGPIPSFTQLSKIRTISLSYNQLTGVLPVLTLPTLRYFDAGSNQLTGTIPDYALDSLGGLSLSSNLLTGTLPLFNQTDMQGLFVADNLLSGAVPNFQNPNLAVLDIGYNLFYSTIPNFNLPKLQRFYADNNTLIGTIPDFANTNLRYLNLSSNQLEGTIPNFQFKTMEELRVAYNQLSGNIPPLNMPYLQDLELQANQLEGCIPAIFKQNCTSNTQADISDNPLLLTQSWSDFCQNDAGICIVNEVNSPTGHMRIAIAPNPVSDHFSIVLDQYNCSEPAYYSLMNAFGQVILTGAFECGKTLNLDVRTLSSGAYVLAFKVDHTNLNRWFIKQ
jgi:hypothetical protein